MAKCMDSTLIIDELMKITGEIKRKSKSKVFDWETCALICKVQSPNAEVWAGIREDMGNTGGKIFENGVPYMKDYVYLHSIWGTPCVEIIREDGQSVTLPCWVWEDEDHKADTVNTLWPESAMAILNEKIGG